MDDWKVTYVTSWHEERLCVDKVILKDSRAWLRANNLPASTNLDIAFATMRRNASLL